MALARPRPRPAHRRHPTSSRVAARPTGRRERDALAADIRTRGYSDQLGAYTGIYDTDELDAAVLLLPVLDFEPAGSPRVAGTIDAIRERLSAGGPLLFRYRRGRDGLAGSEGAFLPARSGSPKRSLALDDVDEANELFEQLLALRQPARALRRGDGPDDPRASRQLPPGAHPCRLGAGGLGAAARLTGKGSSGELPAPTS